MLCWMNVNWIIVVKVEIESCKYVYRFEWELGERWWKKRERICYKLFTPSNIIYSSIFFNILHFLQTGFTRLYMLHLFLQGLKCLTFPIIETYTLAYRIFKISQFNIYKQSNITYFSIIFNILHNYNYQGERTHF